MDYLVAQLPAEATLNAIGSMHIVVRTDSDPASFIPALRHVVYEVDPTVPLREPLTMREVIEDVLTFERLENWLFGAFAVLAVLLAVVGLYGLISHEVDLSTRDIGIRLALGAPREAILSRVYARVTSMLSVGLLIGLVATTAAHRFISAGGGDRTSQGWLADRGARSRPHDHRTVGSSHPGTPCIFRRTDGGFARRISHRRSREKAE